MNQTQKELLRAAIAAKVRADRTLRRIRVIIKKTAAQKLEEAA